MRLRKSLTFTLFLTCCVFAAGKSKQKELLPADVLQARTVVVIIDPRAGVAVDDPNANRMARDAVEQAIMDWGRFTLVPDTSTADLVIMVRKGTGKIVEPTIGGLPNNNPPLMGRHGQGGPSMAGNPSDPTSDPQTPSQARPGIETGQKEDMMAVYRGKSDSALDASPVWRYSAKEALESPSAPAVDAFRKLIAEAEKQQAKKP